MNAQEEHKERCCSQFKNIKRSCRCMAIKEMVREQQQQGQMESEEREQMVKDAMNIPSVCQIDMPEQCDIQSFYF